MARTPKQQARFDAATRRAAEVAQDRHRRLEAERRANEPMTAYALAYWAEHLEREADMVAECWNPEKARRLYERAARWASFIEAMGPETLVSRPLYDPAES